MGTARTPKGEKKKAPGKRGRPYIVPSVMATGSAVAPAANAAIATIAAADLPAGDYEVRVRAGYGGVADVINNMNLRRGATVIGPLYVPAVVNAVPPEVVLPLVRLNGSEALTVNAIGAGAANTVFNAMIVATRVRAA